MRIGGIRELGQTETVPSIDPNSTQIIILSFLAVFRLIGGLRLLYQEAVNSKDMQPMMIFDIVLLIVFAGAVLFGFWKGLAWQIASFAAVIASYFVAMQFRNQVAAFITTDEPWNVFIAMLILYLGTSLVVWLAFGFIRQSIVKFQLKEFDRQAGAILGALKGALLCMVITMFAVTVLGERARYHVITSRSGNFVARTINELSAAVPQEIHEVLDPVLEKFNEKMEEPVQDFSADLNGWLGTPTTNRQPPPSDAVSGRPWDPNSGINLEKLIDKGVDAFTRIGQESINPTVPNSNGNQDR